jgi:hypothetical protein
LCDVGDPNTFGSQMGVRLSSRAGRPLPTAGFIELISVRGRLDPRAKVFLGGLGQSCDVIGNRTRDVPAGSVAPQATKLLQVPAVGQPVLVSVSHLTRGWVCNLLVQLLLGLARVVTLGSKSRRTTTIFYCLILDAPNL